MTTTKTKGSRIIVSEARMYSGSESLRSGLPDSSIYVRYISNRYWDDAWLFFSSCWHFHLKHPIRPIIAWQAMRSLTTTFLVWSSTPVGEIPIVHTWIRHFIFDFLSLAIASAARSLDMNSALRATIIFEPRPARFFRIRCENSVLDRWFPVIFENDGDSYRWDIGRIGDVSAEIYLKF